ncbi:protein of unknown function [Paraburkholderia dioscoreae]|uniref:Uncharacterized protein n=1 Tax=Paraburkholderia dioscoreae TaxID=2604047 RepID=A0A5Q4ZVL0_9BURK|nr:protein of unknown function [Paraburkholderia dioscoreae]
MSGSARMCAALEHRRCSVLIRPATGRDADSSYPLAFDLERRRAAWHDRGSQEAFFSVEFSCVLLDFSCGKFRVFLR